MKHKRYILPIIILAQFFCTSLWFAGNAVLSDLISDFNLTEHSLGHLSSSVQLGFISGALLFAILCIADRYSPSRVFFSCAVLAAIFNLGIIWQGNSLFTILGFRFLTGFFLAGIYPVGMKIASDYYEGGLGKSLGYLVGALVLGTALPHLLKYFPEILDFAAVLKTTSLLAVMGGFMMVFLVPDGPFRKYGTKPDFSTFFTVFKSVNFREAAIGYFGHMWELYAFWTFVPFILASYKSLHTGTSFSIPLVSFLVIAVGAVSCVLSGHLASKFGNRRIAFICLALSCLCCLFSPLFFLIDIEWIFISIMLFWGAVVIADSPLFSTLVAQNASAENKGTGLTIVTCIGFAITIISIQLLNLISETVVTSWMYMTLAIGPMIGLWFLRKPSISR